MLRSSLSRPRVRPLRLLVVLPLLLGSTLTWASAPGVAAASGGQGLSPSVGAGLVPPGGLQPVPNPTPIIINFAFVPDCHGLTQSGCESLLQSRGLHRGTLSFLAPQTPPPYIGSVVVSQSPPAGTLVSRGSAVNLTLQPISVPRPF